MKLLTERLILRQVTKEDKEDIARNMNNIAVSRYLLKVPFPYTIKDARDWIKNCGKKSKERPRKAYNFGIELKLEKKLIGSIDLMKIDHKERNATLGYWLGEQYWGNGIMTEAAERVLDYSFNKLKLRRLNVSAFVENTASNKLIKKLGFRYEGTRRKSHCAQATGKFHDENMYGMLKEDYFKLYNR